MAKKSGGPNKSDAIRKFKDENQDAGPTAIAEGLAKQGIKVSPAFVSTVLSSARRKAGGGRGRRRGPGRRGGSSGVSSSLASLMQAKKLVDQMGSVQAAREALDTLAKILG